MSRKRNPKYIVDLLLLPLVLLGATVLGYIRKKGMVRFPLCSKLLIKVGVFPIIDFYYEPLFDYRDKSHHFGIERNLPGISWNEQSQLLFLDELSYAKELMSIPQEKPSDGSFYINNGSFESGDAEFWYQVVRSKKPKKIIEIGSGNSTLAAILAIKKSQMENEDYSCEHTCIEPFEMPWLESTGVKVIREKVEDIDIDIFSCLEEDDILFIDSSHIIRPVGDVLTEYLSILPTLNKGVIVHIHDIFSPRHYPFSWFDETVR
ncbi:MAG: class I SAM-dependent methyltransferase, partial [Gammaproteobacteria bacterium]|nr:class I SAM-dependent methyltransferase [Gammaproteobacteria bacterium]